MIDGFKEYVKVSDSGVDWIGEIPSHWCVRRLRRLVNIRTGNKDTIDQCDEGMYPFFIRSQIVARIDTWSFDGEAVLTAGDGDVGKVFHYINGKFDYHQRVYKLSNFKDIHGKFFFHTFRSTFGHEVFQGTAKSTVESLRLPMLQNFPVALPPPTEQTAIARFLDHATNQIESYILTKKKLIALLEEQKQVMIHDAVTGQIDVRTSKPYPAYKPSDVQWLGEVPSDWKVQRVKSLFRLRIEKSGSAHGRELLSIYTHIGVRPRKDLEERGNKASTTDDYWIVKKGDLIANKLLAWMGAIGVSHYDGVTSPAYDILMPTVDLESDYYHHLFRTKACLQLFKQRSRGIMDMRLRLYFDQFGQIPVPVPPIEDQRRIISWYNDASIELNHAINDVRHEIELFHEYRTRLIADVVTGKLDVREAAANLPELEAMAEGSGEKTPTKSNSQQSNTTLHNEAPQTALGVGS